ncbi:hypothetical protein [Aquimarina sp. I32.4]|uniref:hypothetical protein n=1 Tax=Aquimarina sp. I32.4 TaxID=2053903 RepID=UPI000CDEFFCA|nr:hypothetical protein [Aquimarina sp. I32.4]
MDILKITSVIITFLFLFINCKDVKRRGYNYEHKEINLKNWNVKENPIEKVSLLCYKKGTDFKTLETTVVATAIIDDYKNRKMTSLAFDSLPILLNKNYKLTINDTIIYNIKNIKTDYRIDGHGPNIIDTVHNMIRSFNINNKEYNFDKPRNFLIPKDAYIIEK